MTAAIATPLAVASAVALGYLGVGAPVTGEAASDLASSAYRPGTGTSQERVILSVRYLPLGRARLDLVARPRTGVHWGGRRVRWYLGRGARGNLRMVRSGTIREARRGVARSSAVVLLPHAGRFRFAAGVRNPPGRPFVATGTAPAGHPRHRAIAAANSYLGARDGYKAFAVIDSEGRLHGRHLHRTFVSASVVKAMLLVAYLRELSAAHRRLDDSDRSLLQPMIHVSDNEAATAVWERVGNPRLRRLARRAGMTDFSIEGDWAGAQISAADQARYFFEMDRLIPSRFRHFANHLLAHIAGYESWGIPAVARPHGWQAFFKGGWRGTWRGQLVHQVARLQKRHRRIAIAVMTDGDPSMDYGVETIQGIARRLLTSSLR
jgi:hypothetical protein